MISITPTKTGRPDMDKTMKKLKTYLSYVMISTCLVSVPVPVYAFPFKEDPRSFERYVNQISNWGDGSKTFFQNLNQCWNWKSLNAYSCKGFVTIVNPMGKKTCNLKELIYYSSTNSVKYKTSQCRNQ